MSAQTMWTDSACGIGSPPQADVDATPNAFGADGHAADLPAETRPPPGEMASQLVAGRHSLGQEGSSAGQDEMTVTREQSLARQATKLFSPERFRGWGSPYTLHRPSGRINRPQRRQVLDCASPLALLKAGSPSGSGRGLPRSKTLSRQFKSIVVSRPQRAFIPGGRP